VETYVPGGAKTKKRKGGVITGLGAKQRDSKRTPSTTGGVWFRLVGKKDLYRGKVAQWDRTFKEKIKQKIRKNPNWQSPIMVTREAS